MLEFERRAIEALKEDPRILELEILERKRKLDMQTMKDLIPRSWNSEDWKLKKEWHLKEPDTKPIERRPTWRDRKQIRRWLQLKCE